MENENKCITLPISTNVKKDLNKEVDHKVSTSEEDGIAPNCFGRNISILPEQK